MGDRASGDGTRRDVEWRRLSPRAVSQPIVRRLPYLELKLEHDAVEPTGYDDRFFPDVVPYDLDGTGRVFYWRPAIAPRSGDPDGWGLACASTHELLGIASTPANAPRLVTERPGETTLVVEGTVGGDATTVTVASYSVPEVSVDRYSDADVGLTVAGTAHTVSTGTRRRIGLDDRRIEPVAADRGSTTVTPELHVRYPGRRELHHPAPGTSYRLFPSFGLDLDDLRKPLSVPTTTGELDDDALAAALDVDLAGRPYPQRVLWQAFAYTAFDPHADGSAALAQLETGHLVVRPGSRPTG